MNFTPSPVLGEVIIDQLILSGVQDVVISPGSRNAPLTMAAWRAAEQKRIRLHTRIDERSAAFLALGIAKATRNPTPVICTSGSASANFYPALLEAHHSADPLIAITADRPERLWKTGANQTTAQVDMFPAAVSETLIFSANEFDIGQVQIWRQSISDALHEDGPSHFNVEFEEPLVGLLDWFEPLESKVTAIIHTDIQRGTIGKFAPRGVILVGHDAGHQPWQEIVAFSQKSGWPIISENPLHGAEVIAHGSLLLADEKRRQELKPEIAMVIGRLTLSRALNAYLALADYQIVVDPRTYSVDTERDADEIHHYFPIIESSAHYEIESAWREKFEAYSRTISERLPELLPEWSEPSVVAAALGEIPAGSTLFIASSRPIRDVEAFVTAQSGIECFANRGLAGIDGNISTASGIALSRQRTYAIVGDLAFLHDVNALLIGKDEIEPNLTVIVISNDGGGIFSTLPQRDVPGFEKIFGTPHGRDLVAISEGFGIPAVGVHTVDALKAQLARGSKGLNVIVAQMPRRDENADLLKRITDSLALL